jgi:hypothetical protein
MNPKVRIVIILQQAAGYHTLRFAGLFNLQASVPFVVVPLSFARGIIQLTDITALCL